jgi:hypothetical protein
MIIVRVTELFLYLHNTFLLQVLQYLKGPSHKIFDPRLQSIPIWSLIIILKYFLIWFRIRRDIPKYTRVEVVKVIIYQKSVIGDLAYTS